METRKLFSSAGWVLAVVFLTVLAWRMFTPAGPVGYGGWHMGGRGLIPWGMGGVMMIFWVFLLVGFVLVIQWISRLTQGGDAGAEPDAIEILKRRYARGEIDRPEFENRMRDLRIVDSPRGPLK